MAGDVLRAILPLKRLKRTGWRDRGIPDEEVESVADHSFMVAMIAWLAADADLDADRCLQLALVHDLAEALIGDLPPYDPDDLPPVDDVAARRAFFSMQGTRTAENAARKRAAEDRAERDLLALLPAVQRDRLRDLWQDYAAQASPEARFVKQIDRLEALIQARDYADRHPDAPVDGFRMQAMREITHPALVSIRDRILTEAGSIRRG